MPKFQAARVEKTFVDDEGVTIHYYVWQSGAPKAVVLIVHGIGEFATRTSCSRRRSSRRATRPTPSTTAGTARPGCSSTTATSRSSGGRGRAASARRSAASGGCATSPHEANPGVPIVLLGHSMGSLFGQRMLNETADDYDAAILSATAYRTLRHMNSGDLAKRHRVPGGNGHEWLSRDPAVAEWFRDNPLTFDAKVAKLFGIADGLRLLGRPRKLSRDIPMLIMIGSDDPLGGPRSVELLAKAYRERGGLTDVTVTIYPEGRHEMFNEVNQDEVRADVVAWLDQHVKPAG